MRHGFYRGSRTTVVLALFTAYISGGALATPRHSRAGDVDKQADNRLVPCRSFGYAYCRALFMSRRYGRISVLPLRRVVPLPEKERRKERERERERERVRENVESS